MSISVEYANEHKDSPAVLCCRAEEGTVLSAHNLEDPAIFDDLEDSGLLSLEGALSIGQVLGARLTKTADSLTPVTLELVDQIQEQEEETEGKEREEAYAQDLSEAAAQAAYPYSGIQGANTLKLHIGEGKGIDIELPLGGYPTADVATLSKKAATQEKETVEMAGRTSWHMN